MSTPETRKSFQNTKAKEVIVSKTPTETENGQEEAQKPNTKIEAGGLPRHLAAACHFTEPRVHKRKAKPRKGQK